jgi:hypothetical protein
MIFLYMGAKCDVLSEVGVEGWILTLQKQPAFVFDGLAVVNVRRVEDL